MPKGLIKEMAWRLRNIELQAPVESGTVVAVCLMGSGADIIATADVKKAKLQ